MQVDLTKLEVAMKYVERMAEGKNPVKNVTVEDDSVLNNPNVIRCMYFIKDVLNAVRDNEGMIGERKSKPSKTPFPYECLSDFQYVDDVSIAHFMNQLKGLARDPNVRGIGTKPVTDWLKANGYLMEILDRYTGKMRPVVTDAGREFGLYMEDRISMNGNVYQIIMYSQKAQEYIATNLEKIVNG